MIQPNHQCVWLHERRTQLSYAADRFTSAGTSLPVLMDAFRDRPLRWYSLPYGEVYSGEPENLLLIAVAANAPGPRGRYEGNADGPLTRALHGVFPVDEYVLSKRAQAALGVEKTADGGYQPTDWQRIAYRLHLHDDCFASVQPADPALRERLVLGTLKLHAYYLGREIDWQDVPARTAALLERHATIVLRTDRETGMVVIERKEQEHRRIWHKPLLPDFAEIPVQGQTANWRLCVEPAHEQGN